MKKYILLSVSTLCFAGCSTSPMSRQDPVRRTASVNANSSEAVYEALNVPEKDGRKLDQDGNPTLGTEVLVKSIGGITCSKMTVVYPGAQTQYSCEVTGKLDSEAIYNSLNAEERDVRQRDDEGNPTLGAGVLGKSVGGLTCKKITVVYPGAKPTFDCVAKF